MGEPTTSPNEKPEVARLEETAAGVNTNDVTAEGYDDYGLVKSRFDELSILETLWVFKRVVLVSLAVYTGYVCEGFELGAGSSIVANTGFIKQFGTEAGAGVRALDPTWLSTWSALLNVGQIVTQTHIAWFTDKFGRKTSFYLAWAWLAIGCILLNTAKTPSVWALAKLCNGAGIGVLQITCQVYVMEICPNKIRGGMVTFQAVWGNIGALVCSVMMQQLNQTHPDDYLLAMRILWAPVGLMIIFWAFVPESPWFHARHGNKEKALKAIKQLYGGIKGYNFEEEYGIIVRTIEHEKAQLEESPRYAHVFKGLNLKRTLTVMILAVSQQFAGLTIISTYSTYFFALAGLPDPFLGAVILSCVNLLAVIVWSLSTDKFGRRTIINTCQTLICVILFIVGGLYWTGATTGNAAAGTALVRPPYSVTSSSIPVNTSFSCYATPPMLLALSVKSGFVYGAFSVPICVLMWLYVPETKGRSAAEIDELYERRIPPWRWAGTVTTAEETMHVVVQAKGGVMEEHE
ncbi:MFS general substrate transporter [Coniochaeta ligniaria NRRL 30616]|uniref:MFS general substrate transporter n=1 Tax=Coniochaeta ligniaria NRRL 30616 TaxID=1408157 RepID=A0A1J7IHE9_9PEZI|nr:MFS general substrate transporter [Coniochaeta ligniaria NRRL 30616]